MKMDTFEHLCVFFRQPKIFGHILLNQLGVLVLCKNVPPFIFSRQCLVRMETSTELGIWQRKLHVDLLELRGDVMY